MMPVRDDISHRKKWLNLHWNYLWGNVWGLTLLQIFKNLCSIKDLKKSFYTLHMSSTGFKMKKKKKAPVCHWYSAYVFHKVSCGARGNTVTVNPLHTSNTGSSFQNWNLGFLEEKRALSQMAIGERSPDLPVYKPPDGNIWWMQTQAIPGDCCLSSLSCF